MSTILQEKEFVPLNEDLIFKEAMCHIDNRDKLVHFLELTTNLRKEVISNHLRVQYESILNKSKYQDKSFRGDVIIEFDGYKINLESYSYFDRNSLEKSISYVMRIFSTQLKRGKDYNTLESVIQINLVDNMEINKPEETVSEYYITNSKDINDKLLPDKFKIKFYRLDKARNMEYNELDEEMRWIRFMGAESSEERKEIAKGDKMLMELNNWVEEYMFDEKTKKYYGEWAEQIAEEKGRKFEKIEIAKNMLKKDVDKKDIAEFTGLDLDVIEKLK